MVARTRRSSWSLTASSLSHEAALGSSSMVVLRRLPSQNGRRATNPSFSLVSVYSGYRQRVYNKLRPRCQDGGPQTPSQKAPDTPPQVVLSLAVRCLSMLRGVQVVVIEQDSTVFSSFLLGPLCKMKVLVCNSYVSSSPPCNR
jgi:hypothetical protein